MTPPAVDTAATRDAGSYRDPAGFVFRREGVVYRQIDPSFAEDWDYYLESGLYESLADAGIVIRHEDAGTGAERIEIGWQVTGPVA